MNEKIERIVRGTKTVADIVSEQTTRVAGISKAYARRIKLELALKDRYAELGKLCYNMYENDTDETGSIKSKIAEIKDIKADLRDAEDTSGKKKICPSCHAENNADDSFCARCGSRL
ncbi:MAG: zinc-ribbon domain-containing protein [Oscillospiraceae bacterium]|nr:zinc-ribbon domain-containing protein [Oscillospiraceae bacterium]